LEGDAMQRIVPHFWFDKQAKEAVEFYVSIFEDSEILSSTMLEGTPSGDTEVVSFMLAGQQFEAISAGPHFKFNPSISLMVSCKTKEELNSKWQALSKGGEPLMPLGQYPFGELYGWIQDRYGLSWQLMLVKNGALEQKVKVSLLFSDGVCGMAEEAVQDYVDIIPNSEIVVVSRYSYGETESSKAKVNFAAFTLNGSEYGAMDHGMGGDFTFNEAVSLMVKCENQQEIDYYWRRLSAVPEAEQCGWLKDKYGLSWQIVPSGLDEILANGPQEKKRRIMDALLKMKKIDLAALE